MAVLFNARGMADRASSATSWSLRSAPDMSTRTSTRIRRSRLKSGVRRAHERRGFERRMSRLQAEVGELSQELRAGYALERRTGQGTARIEQVRKRSNGFGGKRQARIDENQCVIACARARANRRKVKVMVHPLKLRQVNRARDDA